MANDGKPEKPPEFEAFEDLTRKLLDVSKEDLDRARSAHSDSPREQLPESEPTE